MLLDSNIIIYAAQPKHSDLRKWIAEHGPAVSAISYVEVLGYHRLTKPERGFFQQFFRAALILPLSQLVLDEAVRLRQQRKTTLGDALVAATALVHRRVLVTRNTADFQSIQGLPLLDPITLP